MSLSRLGIRPPDRLETVTEDREREGLLIVEEIFLHHLSLYVRFLKRIDRDALFVNLVSQIYLPDLPHFAH